MVRPFPIERIDPRLCIFEFVYLARPESRLAGAPVRSARTRMGSRLARVAPVLADVVMGVPDSGVPAAEGYAREAEIPFAPALVRKGGVGRSFISPTQAERERRTTDKVHVVAEEVRGKRVVVVDDSVVRGTTTRAVARMLRDAGAVEVHVQVALPPVKWPCFYGVDISTREELLSAHLDVEQTRDLLGVDSLGYLTVADVATAIGDVPTRFCDACMTTTPTDVTIELDAPRRPTLPTTTDATG